jgi:hypothetical protein
MMAPAAPAPWCGLRILVTEMSAAIDLNSYFATRAIQPCLIGRRRPETGVPFVSKRISISSLMPRMTRALYERGIRRRLAPMLDGDRRRIELAYSLIFTLTGR